MGQYMLERGSKGAERLQLLSRILSPTTEALLLRAGLAPGWRCLDIGCGTGQVTILMAHRTSPDGLAVGLDPDEHFLDLVRQESARLGISAIFRAGTVDNLHAETGYDLVYARFVLSHLPEPAEVIGQMVRVVHPGGMIVIEDVDFAGHFCYPPNAAFARYVALYQTAVRLRGADPDLGPRLPGILDDAGVESVHLDVILPAFREGEGKRMAWATMEGIQGAVVAAGLASTAEMNAILAELDEFERDRRTIISMPRIFQVWGRVGT